MIKNIIFELGKVLVSFDPKARLEKQGVAKQDIAIITDGIFNDPIWHQYDAGNKTLSELITYYKTALPMYQKQVTTFLTSWYEMVSPLEISYHLLKELKQQGYGIYLLSNINEDCAMHLLNNAPFMKDVDGCIFSYQYHVIKPDRKIYEVVCNTYQLKAEECLLLDDRSENSEAAMQFGMHGIVYEANEEMVCKVKEIVKNEGIQC